MIANRDEDWLFSWQQGQDLRSALETRSAAVPAFGRLAESR
jgi:hypothetical protein